MNFQKQKNIQSYNKSNLVNVIKVANTATIMRNTKELSFHYFTKFFLLNHKHQYDRYVLVMMNYNNTHTKN